MHYYTFSATHSVEKEFCRDKASIKTILYKAFSSWCFCLNIGKKKGVRESVRGN